MLASRLPGILPPMTQDEALASAAIQSVGTRGFDVARWRQRPYRAPHHTASAVALVGGGSDPRPGEISMAMHGVLFLDELPEFDRRVLEVLREPLESGRVSVSRAARQAEFPAEFQLMAAMNPCPCGYLGHYTNRCRCTPDQIQRYRSRISGPLLDRIDLQIEVPAVPVDALARAGEGERSAGIRRRVEIARARMIERQGKANAKLLSGDMDTHCALEAAAATILAAGRDEARAFGARVPSRSQSRQDHRGSRREQSYRRGACGRGDPVSDVQSRFAGLNARAPPRHARHSR